MPADQRLTWPRTRTRVGRAAAALAIAVVGVVGPVSPAEAAPVTINLLTINDFHGRIDANTLKFAGTIESLRQAAGAANTLLVGAGDLIGASLFASASQQDQPTIDVMNEIGVDVSAVGNHEFDQGFADLTDRVIDAGSNAAWDYLGANVYLTGTTTPALPEYGVYTVAGLEVGVIGVVTEETPTLVSPAGVSTLDFGDPVEAINRVAEQLSDGNPANGEADVLVATLHEGAPTGIPNGTLANQVLASPVFASIVNDTSPLVDVIVNGHTHQAYVFDGPIPGQAGTRPIIETGQYATNVGQIQLTVDSDTHEVTGYTARNVARLTTDDAALLTQYPVPLTAINATVQAALAQAAVIGNSPVGSVTADITTAFTGGSYVGGVYAGGTRDDRASESALGNLVANSLVESLSDPDRGGAEIGVVNPGGLRAELLYTPDGIISYAEANGVLPFVNNLVTVSLTGQQFKDILEQQWQLDAAGNVPSRPYLQLGLSDNVSYTCDPGAAQGAHITAVVVDGQPLDLAASYRVGTFSFLAAGGDNFRAFAAGTDFQDSGLIDRDAWIAYLSDHEPLTPAFDRRSVAVTGFTGTPTAGDTLTLQLSKLDLTSVGAPLNTTISAELLPFAPALRFSGAGLRTVPAAVDLGEFAVSGGAATLPLALPATATGPHLLVLTASPSGTVVTLPVSIAMPTPLPTSSSTVVPTTSTSGLSATGVSSTFTVSAVVIGAALVLLGVLIVLMTRRRVIRRPGQH